MSSNHPPERAGQRSRRPGARRRLGVSLAAATSVALGSYLARFHLAHHGHLMHLGFPPGAVPALIITAGIAAVVLGWRCFVYLERHDRHHHEIISEMQDQEGVYLKYEDTSSTYERWPAPPTVHAGRNRCRDGRRHAPRDEKPSRGDDVHLGRHHTASRARAEGAQTGRDPGHPGSVRQRP